MTLLMGSAVFTRHDAHTRHLLDDYRQRRKDDTEEQLLRHVLGAEALGTGWVADEVRHILDSEVERRRTFDPSFAGRWSRSVARGVLP